MIEKSNLCGAELKNVDEDQAKQLMSTLPFYALRKSIEYLPLIKEGE